MNLIFLGMKRLSFALIVFNLFHTCLYAQNQDEIWQELLSNNREKALELVMTPGFEKDVETAILKQIVRMENGHLMSEKDFLTRFQQYPNYEHYLFAHWNNPYIFEDYLGSGFSKTLSDAITNMDSDRIESQGLKNSLIYLQAIAKRYENDWERYEQLSRSIPALDTWEYCGAFENLNESGLVTPYPPEEKAVSEKPFYARSNGYVSWYTPEDNPEPYQFFSNHDEYGAGISYAQTFLQSDSAQRAYLRLGKSGIIRVWLNDVLIFEDTEDVVTEMDAHTIAVNLSKGNNRILVKIASSATTPNFILRVTDEKGYPLSGIQSSIKNKNYKQSTEAAIDVAIKRHPHIAYFEDAPRNTKAERYMADISLFMAYMRNMESDKAKRIILNWLEEYPKSTLLRSALATAYSTSGDEVRRAEISENIVNDDPNYYASLMNKFQDFEELMKLDIETYESTLHNIAEAIDYPYIQDATELFIALRRNNLQEVEKSLDEMISHEALPSSIIPTFADFYSNILSDEAKSITTLEKTLNESFNFEALTYLIYYYKKQDRKDDAIALYQTPLKKLGYDNDILYRYIQLLHEFNQYEKSLAYIDKALQNFPDSFVFQKLKGEALQQLDRNEEAVTCFEKAILRNSGDTGLRKRILDLKKMKDPLEKLKKDDYYEYAKKARNKITTNNYGLNVLLHQIHLLQYENGGGRYRQYEMFEVTSQKGIENIKEYNLGLYGDYTIFKSEIIKEDGSLVPAERSGSSLVFNGLSIGDVVYVTYETNFVKTGRWFKEFIDVHSFGSYHPVVEEEYILLSPNKNLPFTFTNEEVPLERFKQDGLHGYKWTYSNDTGFEVYEDFMPQFTDVAPHVNISTIGSWNDIANWYSDLVRIQVEYDETVEAAFDEIFPNGVSGLSEEEKAKRIYKYVTDDFSYSYVSFKQSGFVPQKPAKTIRTKLGDCKDFSTLYLTLARQAELDANLVLILTSDNGENALVVPSTDFNHCIIKVTIDGKPQYLELTDKYMPYAALPVTLRHAIALEIPYDADPNGKSDLFFLDDVARKSAVMKTKSTMLVTDEETDISLHTSTSGHLSTYYIQMFEEQNEEVLKEDVFEELKTRNDQDYSLQDIKDVTIEEDGTVGYTTDIKWNEKPHSIGSFKTFQIPHFTTPYTQSIVSLEERQYPIDYKQYETADGYEETFMISLEEGKSFIEIPENKSLTFKDHSYSVNYKKVADNKLEVKIKIVPGGSNIEPSEYPGFKEYVKEVLESRKQFLAYK